MPGQREKGERTTSTWQWLRFSSYRILDFSGPTDDDKEFRYYKLHRGWIVPSEGASLEAYDPIADNERRVNAGEPTALDQLLNIDLYSGTDEVLAWVNQFGLLGLMHQNYIEIRCQARPRKDCNPFPHLRYEQDCFYSNGDGDAAWSAGNFTCASPKKGWAVRKSGFRLAIERLKHLEEEYFPRADVNPELLRAVLVDQNALDALHHRAYAEPVQMLIDAARLIAFGFHGAAQSDMDVLNRLSLGSRLQLRRENSDFKLHLITTSLLAALARLAIERLAGGARLITCEARGCGRAKVSTAYQRKYCSRKCQERERKRQQRDKPVKESAKVTNL